MILDPTDQRIRDQGFNFVPFDRFLAAPFQMPNIQTTDPNTGVMSVLPRNVMSIGGEGIGTQANLGSDSRGFIGNYKGFDFASRYPDPVDRGITLEDLSKPSSIGDFSITAAPGLPNQSGYIEEAPQIFEPQRPNAFQRAFGKTLDFGKMAKEGLLSAAIGIPFAGPIISKGLQSLSSRFQSRPLGAPVIDEFGNVYDEEELNKQNALGGFYTEAARSARRRKSRIENMLTRQALGKKISAKNLAELQAQEKAQEAAQQAAFEAAMAQGQGFYDSLNKGRGASVSRSSREEAGSGFGDASESGPFADGGRVGYIMGGLTDLVDIYD